MEKNYHGWFAVCAILLLVVAGILAADMYSRIDEQRRRQRITDDEQRRRQTLTDEVLKSILEVETKRLQVFKDYLEDLQAYETKSIYHQIYHANNAQLKMMNLMVQENQLLATLIAGKK